MKHGIKTLADITGDLIPTKARANISTVVRGDDDDDDDDDAKRATCLSGNSPAPVKTPPTEATTPRAAAKPKVPPPHDVIGGAVTKNDVKGKQRTPRDSQRLPMDGEKPHELLHRLYDMWPAQLCPSYRAPAAGNPEASSDFNFRFLRKLRPAAPVRPEEAAGLHKVKAARVVVETVLHLEKKAFYSLRRARNSLDAAK